MLGHRAEALCPDFPKRPIEKMANGLFSHLSVGQNDVLHFVVPLEQVNRALEEGLRECRVHDVRRVIAQHIGHVVIQNRSINLLETDKVFTRELRPMAVIECLDDLGE